jgi:hypothetical protein
MRSRVLENNSGKLTDVPPLLGRGKAQPVNVVLSKARFTLAGIQREVAFGQKPTFASQQVMSALPPKADVRGAKSNVR